MFVQLLPSCLRQSLESHSNHNLKHKCSRTSTATTRESVVKSKELQESVSVCACVSAPVPKRSARSLSNLVAGVLEKISEGISTDEA